MKEPSKILFKRIAIVLIFIYLLAIVITNFVINVSSSTDENFFSDTPSRYYLVKPINTIDVNNSNKQIINPGAFILSVDGKRLTDTSDFNKLIGKYKPFDEVIISVFDVFTRGINNFNIKAKQLQNGSVIYLNSAVLVLKVFKGGTSERAGMKAGDIIVKINGKQFRNMFEADKILSSARSGDVIRYDIFRKSKPVSLNLLPVRYGVSFVMLYQNLVGLLLIFFGFFIFFSKPENKGVSYLGTGLLFLGTIYALIASRMGLLSSITFYNVLRYLTLIISLNFGIVFLLISTYYFPQKVSIADKKWIKTLFFSLAILLSILILGNRYIIQNFYLNIFNNFSILLLLLIFLIIRIIFRKEYSKEYIRINRPIALLFTLFILIRYILSIFLNWTSDSTLLISYLLTTILLLIVIVYYYKIAKYHLLDLNIRIKRNIQYMLITIIWQIFAFAILVLIIYFVSQININFPNIHIENKNLVILNTHLEPDRQDLYLKIFLITVSIAITAIWLISKRKVQRHLAKRFHRTSFDYRKTASELSRVLARNFSIRDLTKNFALELAELSYLKRAGILIFKNEEFVVASDFYGVNNEVLSELLNSSGEKLVRKIKEYDEDFSVEYLLAPHNKILKEFGFLFIQPIKSKNMLIGAILIGEKKSETAFNSEDFEFIDSISGQISVAVENSFLYEDLTKQERLKHELEIARKIQLASLPDSIPNISGLDISGISLPALEVGGDFYDFLETGADDLMVIIGDVSGKGTSAALYMSKIQGVMRALYEFRLSPRKLLIRTNNLLLRYLEKGFFISATSMNFDTHNMKAYIARAGHLPLYLFRNNSQEVDIIRTDGMVLGLTFDNTFERNLEEREIVYSKGDIFVLITDGISEAKNSNKKEFSEENLIKTIESNKDKTAEEIRDAIVNSAMAFAEKESQYDDMTVVIIKII